MRLAQVSFRRKLSVSHTTSPFHIALREAPRQPVGARDWACVAAEAQ
jgi:hypothetical protein